MQGISPRLGSKRHDQHLGRARDGCLDVGLDVPCRLPPHMNWMRIEASLSQFRWRAVPESQPHPFFHPSVKYPRPMGASIMIRARARTIRPRRGR